MLTHTGIAPHVVCAEKTAASHSWILEPVQSLIYSYMHLLEWLEHRERLRTLNACMARDTGLQLSLGGRFGSYRLDPRPFWNIGHTPLPIDTAANAASCDSDGPIAFTITRRWWVGGGRT